MYFMGFGYNNSRTCAIVEPNPTFGIVYLCEDNLGKRKCKKLWERERKFGENSEERLWNTCKLSLNE